MYGKRIPVHISVITPTSNVISGSVIGRWCGRYVGDSEHGCSDPEYSGDYVDDYVYAIPWHESEELCSYYERECDAVKV